MAKEMKMTPFMMMLKQASSLAGSGGITDEEELKKHRESQERASRVAAPSKTVEYDEFDVAHIKCEWALPKQGGEKDYENVILYCHGGGFSSGGLGYARLLAGKMASTIQMPVCSYAYRLSPEYKYPAAIIDTMMVWEDLLSRGYEAKDIIVAGDSAGGNLALQLCLSLRAEGKDLPKAVMLFSPWTDMTMTSKTYEKYAEFDPILQPAYIKNARAVYTGDDVDYKDPHYSPLFSDFSGFPPTLIQVGSHEILRGDSTNLSRRMKLKKVDVTLTVYDEAWHVFQQMPGIKTNKALKQMKEFVEGLK